MNGVEVRCRLHITQKDKKSENSRGQGTIIVCEVALCPVEQGWGGEAR